MEIELDLDASVQNNHWQGSVAANDIVAERLEEYLGIDPEKWRIIRLEISIDGGNRYISGWGVESDSDEVELIREAQDSGILELTKLVDFEEHLIGHHGFDPPYPDKIPVTSAVDLFAIGFKRMKLVIYRDDKYANIQGLRVKQVDSIVEED